MYFKGVNTIEELRKQYRELLKKHHPDNGGDVSVTQEINAEYDRLFDVLRHSENTDEKTYTKEEDEQFRAILNAVSAYNIDVQVIGSWIWCFNSYPYREQLKSLGFSFAPKKKAWTWHSEPYHRHHKGEVPLSHIREKYGCETVRNRSYQYSLEKGSDFMCMMNGKPVSEYNSPCGHCPDYLCACNPLVMNGYIFGECDLSYCEFCECYDDCMNVGYNAPLEISMYEDTDTEPVTEQTQPIKFSKAQYNLLCKLIRQKHISKDFFYRLLVLLYGTEDWKSLDYQSMYVFIGFLIHWDFKKARV